eukprot:g7903.t2
MEAPLHPTPMQRPMMKGKIYVDASNKPTFQGIWGMTHADVNKGGHTNDFKVVRMESVKEHEIGLPVFAGKYIGYFKLTTGFQTETVHEDFTLTFRGHSNHGYNVYGAGENRYGRTEIVGTVTQTGKMEIFKMIPGTTVQPDPSEPTPALPRPANPRAISPPPPALAAPMARPLGMGTPARAGGVGGARPKSGGSTKKKPVKRTPTAPPPSKNGLPGVHVRTLKDCLLMLKKTDKNNVFQFPVPPHFRGLKGLYADVIKNPMDLGTVSKQIDSKYRTVKDCIADVRLVFSNAKEFNPDTDPVHALAASLSGKFEAFVSNNRHILGLDGSAPAGPGSVNKSPAAPSTAASTSSMSLSAASANAGASIGKRIGTPPSVPSAGGVTAKEGGGGAGAGVAVLSAEEQEQLAKDVNHLFHVGNANPNNERAQARVYALWTFAKAYVADKDRVAIDGGKGAEIKMDALNHVRQRQLRDVVSFFMQDSKNDPKPEKPATTDSVKPKVEVEADKPTGEGEPSSSGRPGKRPRSDVSDSENEDEEAEEDAEGGDGVSPGKSKSEPSRDDSEASKLGEGASGDGEGEATEKKLKPSGSSSNNEPNGSTHAGGGVEGEGQSQGSATTANAPFGRVDSSSLTLEATASTLKDTEIDLDLDEDEDEEEDGSGQAAGGATGAGSGSGGEGAGGSGEGSSKAATTGKMDEQWLQAQAERKEREEREKARAEREKALEEQRLKQQAQREKERVEEGLRLSRERAAEKARVEKAALEKANREKKELEDKKEAERLAREGTKASVDLDQVRADSQLMELMDESIYDD